MKIPGSFFTCVLTIAGCASVPNNSNDATITSAEAHNLCYGYIYGKGLSLDFQKARFWCEKAANAGQSSSETLYAELYYFGEGGPVDFERAAFWYEKAAEQGHVHAEFMLFNLYVLDKYRGGVFSQRGVEMLRKAASLGYQKAIDALAQYEKRT
jgi:TPR repeat protein